MLPTTRLRLHSAESCAIVLSPLPVLPVKMHLTPQGHLYKCPICPRTCPSVSPYNRSLVCSCIMAITDAHEDACVVFQLNSLTVRAVLTPPGFWPARHSVVNSLSNEPHLTYYLNYSVCGYCRSPLTPFLFLPVFSLLLNRMDFWAKETKGTNGIKRVSRVFMIVW